MAELIFRGLSIAPFLILLAIVLGGAALTALGLGGFGKDSTEVLQKRPEGDEDAID